MHVDVCRPREQVTSDKVINMVLHSSAVASSAIIIIVDDDVPGKTAVHNNWRRDAATAAAAGPCLRGMPTNTLISTH